LALAASEVLDVVMGGFLVLLLARPERGGREDGLIARGAEAPSAAGLLFMVVCRR